MFQWSRYQLFYEVEFAFAFCRPLPSKEEKTEARLQAWQKEGHTCPPVTVAHWSSVRRNIQVNWLSGEHHRDITTYTAAPSLCPSSAADISKASRRTFAACQSERQTLRLWPPSSQPSTASSIRHVSASDSPGPWTAAASKQCDWQTSVACVQCSNRVETYPVTMNNTSLATIQLFPVSHSI